VPQNLIATAGNAQVTLKWNKNTEPDFLRYRIYQGTSPNPTTKVDSTTGGITDTVKTVTGLTNGTMYYFRVTAVDSAGNESNYSNEVGATPFGVPTITSFTPISNALNVAKNTNIAVTFNRDINQSTINNSTIVVHAFQTGLHTGTYSYNSSTKTATFDPDNDFVVGEIVAVTLTTGIKTLIGDPLPNPYEWSFTIRVNAGSGKFKPKTDYGTSDANSVFSSDLDGDGDMDVAVANDNSSNTISVFLNKGNGTFAPKTDYAVGSGPQCIFSSDLDSDGDMDLSVANSNSNNVSVLLNNGNGTFQEKTNYGTGYEPSSVFSSDLDGDGDMDLVVTNFNSDNVSILLNNGDGYSQRKWTTQ